jgi:hypothetical protein
MKGYESLIGNFAPSFPSPRRNDPMADAKNNPLNAYLKYKRLYAAVN